MMRVARNISAFMLTLGLLAVGPAVHANTITFDDFDASALPPVPSPYQGFDFPGWTAWTTVGNSYDNYPNAAVSTPNFIFSGGAFDDNGVPVGIGGKITPVSGTFTFNSAYMTYAHLVGQQVLVEGFNGATKTFSRTITLSSPSPTLFTFNWTNLTELDFTTVPDSATSNPFLCDGNNCSQFTLDNLRVNESIPTGIPEPATLALLGAGLLGLGALRRRAG